MYQLLGGSQAKPDPSAQITCSKIKWHYSYHYHLYVFAHICSSNSLDVHMLMAVAEQLFHSKFLSFQSRCGSSDCSTHTMQEPYLPKNSLDIMRSHPLCSMPNHRCCRFFTNPYNTHPLSVTTCIGSLQEKCALQLLLNLREIFSLHPKCNSGGRHL